MNDSIDSSLRSGSGMELNATALEFLEQVRKWTAFLSILGFIGLGFLVLVGIGVSTFMSSMGDAFASSDLPSTFPTSALGLVYAVAALIYVWPILYLYRFSSHLKAALHERDNERLTEAFRYLKAHYRFIGILAIIMLSFYALAIVFGLLAAVFAS